MAVTRRQSAVAAGDPPAPTFASTPVEGNLLVAISAHRSGSSETCTIDGTGWTEHIERSVLPLDTSHRRGLAVYSKVAGAAEPTSVSTVWATAEPGHRLLIQEFQGDAGEVFAFLEAVSNDNGATNSGSGGNVSTGTTSSLTAQAMLLVSCIGLRDGAAPTVAGTHWTNALDETFSSGGVNGIASGSGYWEESTAGTKSDTWFHDSGNDTGLTAGLLVFTTTAAGGDVTVNPDTGTATLSGNAPTVVHIPSAAAGALTLTGLAPSLVFSVAPSVGTLTLTGLAPTVTITSAAGVGTATLSGFAPTIDAGADVTVEPDTGIVALSGFAPTVSITVAAGLGTLSLSGLAPTISFSASPTLATLTVTGFTPTVKVDTSAGVGTLTFSGLAPSLLYSVSPETGALSLIGFDPEVSDFAIEEQDLTLAPVTKAPLFLGQGGSGSLDLGAGSQDSLVLVMEGHRYWRLLIDAIQSSTTRGDIWEVELRETEGGADATTSSLTTTASDGAFSSGNAFDNDTGTFWGPTPAVGAWVQVDAGAGQTIAVAEWTLHHGFADFMPANVRLQWSDDAVTWHTHDTRTGLVWTPPQTQTFTLVAARDPLVKSSLTSSSGTKGTLTLAD